MSIEGQGHFFTIYFPGSVCFVLYKATISGERLQDHWSSGSVCQTQIQPRSYLESSLEYKHNLHLSFGGNWKGLDLQHFCVYMQHNCQLQPYYAPVICIPGPLGAGDTGDIAGLKCRNLTSDVSRQCRGCAGVLISR